MAFGGAVAPADGWLLLLLVLLSGMAWVCGGAAALGTVPLSWDGVGGCFGGISILGTTTDTEGNLLGDLEGPAMSRQKRRNGPGKSGTGLSNERAICEGLTQGRNGLHKGGFVWLRWRVDRVRVESRWKRGKTWKGWNVAVVDARDNKTIV